MNLPLVLLAASLALLVYGLASLLPLPPDPAPHSRPTLLYPLEVRLRRELERAGLRLAPRLLLQAMLVTGALGGALA
ncbi:MAG TPA: hypothetical protein VK464_09720, partial [Symbiobacteriaceae bacterium]|nr:hypothetical protein [Symbiobacteriaceae bacterium]